MSDTELVELQSYQWKYAFKIFLWCNIFKNDLLLFQSVCLYTGCDRQDEPRGYLDQVKRCKKHFQQKSCRSKTGVISVKCKLILNHDSSYRVFYNKRLASLDRPLQQHLLFMLKRKQKFKVTVLVFCNQWDRKKLCFYLALSFLFARPNLYMVSREAIGRLLIL